MECHQYCVYLKEEVYRTWCTIRMLEDLNSDEDVACFLVTLYLGQKQREGEESRVRCADCHCPLSLYCSTCHCPSPLTLHTQPPPPSLSLPPPPPPPIHALDATAPVLVTDHTPHPTHQTLPHPTHQTLSCVVQDEEDSPNLLQDEGDHCLDLDVVKTECSFSASDNESGPTPPAVLVHSAPAARMKLRKSIERWIRKNAKASSLEISGSSTVRIARARKGWACSPSLRNRSREESLLTDTAVQSTNKNKKSIHKAKIEEGCSQNKNNVNDGYSTQETPNSSHRKRKPCSSQDLEKGHILAVEERHLAQIDVYDQRFIDHHRQEDQSFSQHEKKRARQALIVKSVPRKRGRKRDRANSMQNTVNSMQNRVNSMQNRVNSLQSPTGPSSNYEQDTVDYQICDGQSNHPTHMTGKSIDDCKSEPANGDSGRPHTSYLEEADHDHDSNQWDKGGDEKFPTLKHILCAPKVENCVLGDEGNSKDRQPFRILVSAQKILPLLTSSGNPAHNFYSYFECAHCRKAFTHKRAFNSHVQAHLDNRIYKCTFCDRCFQRPCDRIIHEKRHKYRCEVCGYKYLEYSMIKEHMKLHVLKCPGCSFETSDFDAYKRHKTACECLKPTLQCEICGVRLKSQKALSFHIAAIHQNNRPFKCSMCDKCFVLQTKLNSHMRDVHAEDGKRFHCDKCGYRSFHAHSLKIHQMCVHSNERPHKCPHCPSAFARKVYLTIHLRKHTGEKPHRCSECLQTFTQRASLTRHIRAHHHAEGSDSKKLMEPQCLH